MNMDRFKRRVWDKKRGRMHYGDMDNLMFGLGGMLFWQFAYGSPEPISIDERDDYVPMDCTGLKDSEGNLIYEGDILTTEDAPLCSIRWCERGGGFEFYVYENGEQHESHMHFTGHDADTGKVLGNIYEHPSLLEVEK